MAPKAKPLAFDEMSPEALSRPIESKPNVPDMDDAHDQIHQDSDFNGQQGGTEKSPEYNGNYKSMDLVAAQEHVAMTASDFWI